MSDNNKKQTAREWAREHYVSYPCYIQGGSDGEVNTFSLSSFLDEYDRRKEVENPKINTDDYYYIPFCRGSKVWVVYQNSIEKETIDDIEIRIGRAFFRMVSGNTPTGAQCHKTFDEAAAHYKKEYGDDE